MSVFLDRLTSDRRYAEVHSLCLFVLEKFSLEAEQSNLDQTAIFPQVFAIVRVCMRRPFVFYIALLFSRLHCLVRLPLPLGSPIVWPLLKAPHQNKTIFKRYRLFISFVFAFLARAVFRLVLWMVFSYHDERLRSRKVGPLLFFLPAFHAPTSLLRSSVPHFSERVSFSTYLLFAEYPFSLSLEPASF